MVAEDRRLRCNFEPQVLQRACGTDVTDLFNGLGSLDHNHSIAARELLHSYCIGSLKDGGAVAASPPEPSSNCFPGIDENQPLLWQVGSLGDEYMKWVHLPVPGQPRFFKSDWAEAVTKVQWWVVPLLWLPLVAHSLLIAAEGLDIGTLALFVGLGLVAWQFMEYSLHRFVFHLCPDRPLGIFLHFLLHGCHHKYPMDTERLVFPPIPASWVIGAVYAVLHVVAPRCTALSVFGGMLLGYVAYDCMHYFMHSGVLGGPLKAAHMRHHYVDPTAGYGISSPLFDVMLGTAAVKGR